jgi:HEPN domain-containing protein
MEARKPDRMTREALINSFAIWSFRDTADQDYVVARMAYRALLYAQFHWSALQAVEKYLKAILLLNRIRARDVSHELEKALEYAKELPFELRLTDQTVEFLEHLDSFAKFRYLESSYHVIGHKIVRLDRAVWEIRRYCRVLGHVVTLDEHEGRRRLEKELDRIRRSEDAPPHLFRLPGGLLERIIDDRAHPARAPLVWKNLFFGTRHRKSVKLKPVLHAINAPLWNHPEILDEVLEYIFLPKDIVAAYRAERKKRQSG